MMTDEKNTNTAPSTTSDADDCTYQEQQGVPMLSVTDLHVYYGAIHALKGLSLTVQQGEIVTLIGANGAGKSTTLRAISGLIAPRSGDIAFEGDSIAGHGAHEIVRRGISQVRGAPHLCRYDRYGKPRTRRVHSYRYGRHRF